MGDKNDSFSRPSKVLENVLEYIGNTPMVKINNITKSEDIKCQICGSVKDRIGKRMVEDAEKRGIIKPGDVIIEPSSGNTGIGLALSALVKGYRCIITIPEKMSLEKIRVLKALGAEIIRTPTEASFDSLESNIGVANKLLKEIPNSHILDQYSNPSNPLVHYEQTGEEIWDQVDGKIDILVASVGTGGTITGIARKLKEKNPNIIIVGVDPIGSILAEPESLGSVVAPYQVEGIGYDFIPDVLDRSFIDKWVKVDDANSFIMARRLIREEGLLCGGSSGSTMYAALKIAKYLPASACVVVILPDSVRNYMNKFLSDDWMSSNGYLEYEPYKGEWWCDKKISELKLSLPVTITPEVSVNESIGLMKSNGINQIVVMGSDSDISGIITQECLISSLINKKVKLSDPIYSIINKKINYVDISSTLGYLIRILEVESYTLVIDTQPQNCCTENVGKKKNVVGVATRIDLLNFISGDQN